MSVDDNNAEDTKNVQNETDEVTDESKEPSNQNEPGPSCDEKVKVELPEEGKAPEAEEAKELPFQLQITYTNRHNVKMTRIITKKMPCSRKREDAEKGTKGEKRLHM